MIVYMIETIMAICLTVMALVAIAIILPMVVTVIVIKNKINGK
jgi:hypothetical protein